MTLLRGGFVAVLEGLRKYSAAFYLVMLLASASLASANGLGPYDSNAQAINPTNESSIKTCLGTKSECFTEYNMSSRNPITDMEGINRPAGSMIDFLKETTTITLHKDGEKTLLSIAPSVSKFSLNPIENVKRLQVMLRYTFWF